MVNLIQKTLFIKKQNNFFEISHAHTIKLDQFEIEGVINTARCMQLARSVARYWSSTNAVLEEATRGSMGAKSWSLARQLQAIELG